jgi:hypothetical protein
MPALGLFRRWIQGHPERDRGSIRRQGCVQRCRAHKVRNVAERLPAPMRTQVKSVMHAAYTLPEKEGMAQAQAASDRVKLGGSILLTPYGLNNEWSCHANIRRYCSVTRQAPLATASCNTAFATSIPTTGKAAVAFILDSPLVEC